jgi:hypothetical protein
MVDDLQPTHARLHDLLAKDVTTSRSNCAKEAILIQHINGCTVLARHAQQLIPRFQDDAVLAINRELIRHRIRADEKFWGIPLNGLRSSFSCLSGLVFQEVVTHGG